MFQAHKEEDLPKYWAMVKESTNPVILRLCKLIQKAEEKQNARSEIQKQS